MLLRLLNADARLNPLRLPSPLCCPSVSCYPHPRLLLPSLPRNVPHGAVSLMITIFARTTATITVMTPLVHQLGSSIRQLF